MSLPHFHIIGAGLSGLSAATHLAEKGYRCTVYESAGQAGGRCRSFYDRTLERVIDNGNHLVMSGNRGVMRYLARIKSQNPLIGPQFASYPFVDIKSRKRWSVRINEGPIPFWIFDERWRVPDTKLTDYFKAAKIAFAKDNDTVADFIDEGDPLYARFWEPLTLAVLNTTPQLGQAKLLWSVIRETFALGGQASRPLVAREGLGPAFIEPALMYLEEKGSEVRLNTRLRGVEKTDTQISHLYFPDQELALGEMDRVIIAVPPSRLKQLIDEVDPPEDNASILNVHYRCPGVDLGQVLGGSPFVAMLSSDAHWAFVRDDVVSLTVSASHAIGMDEVPNAQVVEDLWRETQIALALEGAAYDAVRVIRERRATPDQSPAAAAKRLAAATMWNNLWLAGDHTDTGVPATIEGSLRSGEKAARLALGA